MIEKVRKWIKDKTGVSPIIAIILMVAITVVLAATIYVWVSGFGGGGGGANVALSLKQREHGGNTTSDWYWVEYEVQSVSGNPGWEDLEVSVGGVEGSFNNTDGSSLTEGSIDAGDIFRIYVHVTAWDDTDDIVGEKVTIIHSDSDSIIFSADVTYA